MPSETRAGEEGFSLLELMVVVMIIALLMAVAVPTLMGSIDRANDRGAQADLRRSLVVAVALASDQGGWFRTSPNCAADPIQAADMGAAEPSVIYVDGASAAPIEQNVGIEVLGASCAEIRMIRRSKSDVYFGLSAQRDGRVGYCRGELASVAAGTSCVDVSW